MRKLLFSLLLLSSMNLFSQDFKVVRVNDTLVTNSHVILKFPKKKSSLKVVLPLKTLVFKNISDGDSDDESNTMYSNDDKFKFVFSKYKIDVYENNKILYNLEIEKNPLYN